MQRIINPYFNIVRMINVTTTRYISLEIKLLTVFRLNRKRNLSLLFVLLCSSFIFAQAPTISYSGVQGTYTVNTPMTTLTPTLGAGTPTVRTNVATIAGNGTSGYADGTIASPKFYSPTGIAISAAGNMYIADSQNHCIRKITAAGFVSTLAGSGIAGFLNGTADVAQFNIPYSVAVDASENVYVTESNSDAIRKITPAGVVTTFAGDVSISGYLDGQGTSALFNAPKGMDVDASGNLYVADGNNRIRKISSSGAVTTLAGDGTSGFLDGQGTAARFNNPVGIALAGSGVVYVTDAGNNRIRAISISGTVTTFAGSGASGMVNGQGTAAQFNAPRAVTVDTSGNLYVVDYNNNRVRKITSSGSVTTLSGTGGFGAVNGVGTSATFKYPEGIAVDASGNVFVGDVTNNTIRKITSAGDTSTYAGSATRGLENGQSGIMAMFNSPIAVAVNSAGVAYVIDDFNSCIRKVTTNGIVSTFVGNTATGYADGTGTAAYFNNPKGIALDAAGNIYIADTFNNRIRKITASGVVTTIAGDGTAGYLDGQGTAAKFNNPYGLTVDSAGNIYVADTKNHRIRKISTSGAVTTVAGYILSGYADGASAVARFKNPQGIVIDNATGILYIADTTNNRIRKIATDGTVSTFAGSFAGYQDDQGTSAYFNSPMGITIDGSGNLYVGDYYNSVIRKITNTGLVSTYAGNGSSEYMDGIGNVASFYFPVGVDTDAAGNVYVADSYTQRIRKITSVDPYAIAPTLPTGMNFNSSTGVISGTPTEVRTSMTYTIGASNYTGTGTAAITFATGTGGSTPAAPTASAQSFCNSASVANLVATGTALKWYNVATGGTALASTVSLSTTTYYVSQTVNAVESLRTAVAVTINTTATPSATAQSFCGLSTVANLVATGTALKWYTVLTGGTALASTTTLATGTYYVSQTLNSCESTRISVAVTINTTPAPTASAQSFSNGTIASLVATGTTLQWYSSATGGTALASTLTLTTGTYYASQTLNSCESARTAVSVTINTAPGAPTASGQTFCGSATVSNLTATGTALKWYNVATGGAALASTTALATGNYYVSQTVNSVESSRTVVAVTVNATTSPTASAQAFCNSATVNDLVETGTATQWYTVATGGTALASTAVLATGTYYVSQTLNSCESSRTAVSVTVNTTAAPTASSQSFCGSSTVSNLVATGTALKWYNVSTGGTVLASTTALVNSVYYVTQTLNSCESSRTSVTVTINTTVASTASAQAFCTSASVANLVATGTSLKWYNASTGGTALASTVTLATGTYYVSQTLNSCESFRTAVPVSVNIIAAPTASSQTYNSGATVAGLVATGTSLQWYTTASGGTALASTTVLSTGNYYVSQTLNSCESPRAVVAVTINTAPGAPTASAQSFCNSANVANLVATGTALRWYNVASGGTALASTTALSTGTYYVSQTVNSLESSRTSVSVTINTTVAPPASAQSFCNLASVANLVATGTALQWYTVASGGTALLSTTALATGNYYVSQTLNSCVSSRTTVTVTVNTTAAPTASAQTFSNGATVANLVAAGTSLQWYTVASGGTALSSTTTLSTGNYYVSQTLNSCESSRTLVAVTINTAPGAPTASAQTFCNSATVANLVATGIALKWYNVSTGGTALASTTTLSSATYYVSQTVNSIESSRTAVSVTINFTPMPTSSSQSFCGTATVDDLVATGTALRWYTVSTGGTGLPLTTTLTNGVYYVSQTLNSCESNRILIGVSINTTSAPTASAQAFCNTATVDDLEATGTSLKWYTSATGGTALALTTALINGTYYVSQTLNSCESSRTAVAVTINTTIAPTASAQTFSNGATVADLVATGTSLQWYTSATGGTALALATALSTGNYYVSQTLNSCESPRTLVTVTINTAPGAPTASAQAFCGSANVDDLVATGTALKWYNVATGGTALALTAALYTGNYYVSQTVNSIESSRTTVSVTVNTTLAPTALAQAFCGSSNVDDLVATGSALQWYSSVTGGTALALTTALSSGAYYVSQTLNSCESSRTAVTVTVSSTVAPTASAQTFDGGATVDDLVATGTSLQWYASASGGTALALTAALSTGNYYVSQTLNSCESSRTLVAVTITTAPGAPTASAQTFCGATTVASLVATGTSLQWYTVATGGTALASTTALSTRNYYVSQTINSVESARTIVAVTINTTPAPSVSSQTFCGPATVANLVATGTSIKWYTVGTGGTPLASTTALSNGVYYVSQTLNSCESSRMIISVNVINTAPPIASAQSFCNAAMVSNLVATGTALKWYNLPSGGTALVPSTGLVTGNFYVSQTVNSCESARTLVSVTMYTSPAPTASAQTFLSGATVANLIASGTSLQWFSAATGGTALASSVTLATGNYYVSQTVNFCESPRTLVAVTITTTTTPNAPAATAQSFCNSATVANLVATGTSLKWYNAATGGTALVSNTALATGTYYVSQTVSSVESPRSSVAVTINTTAVPSASAQTFCNSAIVSNLAASGTSLKWYSVATGGTALASTTTLTTGTYYVSQTLNSCESARTSVLVTINSTAAPTASSQAFTSGATVASLVAAGTSLKWYNVATGGIALASTTALTTGTYYVSQTLNSCESSRTSVAVTVNGGTVNAPTAFAQYFCTSARVSNLTAIGTSLKWYTTATGGIALSSTTSLTTRNYYVSQTVNAVESPRTLVAVTIYPAPVADDLSTPTFSGSRTSPICTSDVKVINVDSNYSATSIQWEVAVVGLNTNQQPASSSYVAIEGATGVSYTVENAVPGRNYFRAKFINGNCEASAVYSNPIPVFYRECSSSKLTAVVYPNPYIETFKINLSAPSGEVISISIYDMMGKLLEQRLTTTEEIKDLELGEQYPSGIYNIIVAQEDLLKTLRVIKR